MESIQKVRQLSKDKLDILLSDEALTLLQKYEALLVQFSQQMNLTAIKDHEGIWFRHYLDCLSIIPFLTNVSTLLDIGTGAGFPGLVIAIVCPNIQVTLLDATAKKIAYLNKVIEELQLTNVTALCGRAEELGHSSNFREFFDCATTRAVSSFRTVAEISSGLVKVGGKVVLMRGPLGAAEADENGDFLEMLGFSIPRADEFTNPITNVKTFTVIITKSRPLKTRLPRSWAKMVAQSDKNRRNDNN